METTNPKSYLIDLEPLGRRGQCSSGRSYLDCARQLGAYVTAVCGGAGKCRTCRVQVLTGPAPEPNAVEREVFPPEELEAGWRLACQHVPVADSKLYIPPESLATSQRVQTEGYPVAVCPEPAVRSYHLEIPPPSRLDTLADADRILEALNARHQLACNQIDIGALRELPSQLRSWTWQCQAAIRGHEVVGLNVWPSPALGLAVDLGTTKIAGYLVDLTTGETVAAGATMNPQVSYGDDVLSRISRAIDSPQDGFRFKEVAVGAINALAAELSAQARAKTSEILDVVVVGNTAMHHLLLGLPVRYLARSPFVPVLRQPLDIRCRDLGFRLAPGAFAHLLPNIGGFVGGDHVAMLLAADALEADGLQLAIDIGTNTEVSLIKDGRITSASCASGPAFEGGHIKDGMRAATGAIERLRLVDGKILYQTVDGAPPVGMCGSGVLDAVSELHLAGVLDSSGKMRDCHSRVRAPDGRREFVLVGDEELEDHSAITVSQQDVRQLQLAKAAIRAGIQVLLEARGHLEEEIDRVSIAGAFGSYIDIESAVNIGMLPCLPLNRFHQVGNAAGSGARLALVSLSKRAEARSLASKTDYIELASADGFPEIFLEATHLGKYRIHNGHRKQIGTEG